MKLILLLFTISLSAQSYKYDTVYKRTASNWELSEIKGTVKITNDSIKISNGKEFEVLSKQKFIRIGDTVFTCSNEKYLRLICNDKLGVYYELQISESGKFEKYCLVIEQPLN